MGGGDVGVVAAGVAEEPGVGEDDGEGVEGAGDGGCGVSVGGGVEASDAGEGTGLVWSGGLRPVVRSDGVFLQRQDRDLIILWLCASETHKFRSNLSCINLSWPGLVICSSFPSIK